MPKIKVIEKSNRRNIVYYREVKNKSSQYKGVYLKHWAKKKKWAVKLSLHNKVFHIESFENEDEAAACYDIAIKLLLGKKAYQNQEQYKDLVNIKLSQQVLDKINSKVLEAKNSLDPFKLKQLTN